MPGNIYMNMKLKRAKRKWMKLGKEINKLTKLDL